MIKKNLILAALVCILLFPGFKISAQHYWVYFTDKDGVDFDPYAFFDAHTIERRLMHNMPLVSFSDLPVCQQYIEKISEYADSVGYVSRWFNAMAVVAGEDAIATIAQLPFVNRIALSAAIEPRVPAASDENDDDELTFSQSSLLETQVEQLGMTEFVRHELNGKGIRIAIFDGGFPSYLTHPAFKHINQGKRILHTWDFTKNRENVNRGIAHGTMVLSCIAGIINDQPMGLATEASFMLAITEIRTEPFKEEQNWLAAAEWAEKHGADIINSSLGYTANRYFNEQMDGKTAFVSRAANMAASKGILVVNAAGNEGTNKWKIIGAPADADSVLSIGGVSPWTGYHTSFSSFGPTADKKLKPNVVAAGHVAAAGKKGIKETQGTSFASPLVAGFAACAWQSDRSLNNMELFRKIEQSGHLYPYYDYAHGYGIPQAAFFTDTLTLPKNQNTFTLEVGAGGHFKITCNQQSPSSQDLINEFIDYEEETEESYETANLWESEVYEEMTIEAEAIEAEVVEAEVVEETMNEPEETGETEMVEEEIDEWTEREWGDDYSENYDYKAETADIRTWTNVRNNSYLYLHVRNPAGVIRRYMLVDMEDSDVINTIENELFEVMQLQFGETLCVHFRGQTECYTYDIK